MNHVDVSISPWPPAPGPHGGFVGMFEENAALRGQDAAVSWVVQGGIHTLHWQNYLHRVRTIAAGFLALALGLGAGEAVVIAASNRIEHLVADWASIHCRAVTVTTYTTLAHEQLAHVIADCQPRILVLENAAMLRKFNALDWVQTHRPQVVVMDEDGAADLMAAVDARSWHALESLGAQTMDSQRETLAARAAAIVPGDAATYIYTSGTTGHSKGVTLTHGGLQAEVDAMIRWGGLDYGFKSVSYLPLAHVAERLWSIYLAARTSGHVMCCPDPNRLMDLVRIHRPTYFMAVPRVWEKLRTAFELALGQLHAAGRSAEVEAARQALRLEFALQQEDAALPDAVQMDACRAREGVLRDLRTSFGLDKTVMPSCSAAPLRPDVTQFFAALGIRIHQGYGLTETGGPAVADRLGRIRIGSVGMALPGMDVAVADDGELLIRSPANTPGYRNLPAATRDLYTADGWLRTGDIGRIDAAGRVYLTDRKKELIVNSSGKNIAPTAIESRIAGRGFISQALAHGDGQAFIVALLTVDADKLRAFAAATGIRETDLSRLVADPQVVAEAQLLVDDANAFLSRPEQIKRFVLLPREWRVDDGEVTPTFKLKRRVIHERHQSVLERLHEAVQLPGHATG